MPVWGFVVCEQKLKRQTYWKALKPRIGVVSILSCQHSSGSN